MRPPILSPGIVLLGGLAVAAQLPKPLPFNLLDLLQMGENITVGHAEWSPHDGTIETSRKPPKIPGENPLYLCSQEQDDDIVWIDNIDLVPNHPKRGKDLQVTASGNLSAVIDEGTAMHLQVRLDGTRILNRDYDLCAELKRFGQLCPITADHLIVSQTIRVAKSIPKGKYRVHVRVRTPSNQQVTCFKGKIHI